MTLKNTISEIASTLGFQRTVIGGLAPMEAERAEFQSWLNKGYAAGMEWLKRNPGIRTAPQMLFPYAKSAIVVSASYYTPVPPSPGPTYGRVARYAVGLDYHAVLRAKLRQLKANLEEHLQQPLIGKAYTDDVALYEQAYATRAGLGFAGKNTLIIGPRLMGSYNFVAELFTDLEIEPDEPYQGTCGQCFRCGDICPTKAIVDAGTLDAGLCISYLTIENKAEIPIALRPKMANWVFGCDLCQEVCPYNQRPAETPWIEFRPQSGAGHHVDLIAVLKLKTEEAFRAKFGHTPLRRPRRRGFLRNSLVVLGNNQTEEAVPEIFEFACEESDAMLREHAAWALLQIPTTSARRKLELLVAREEDEVVQNRIREYLENCPQNV
jgi:epoxyqueuosine reductase